MGYIGWLGTFEGKQNAKNYKSFESLIVKDLRSMGAVLYVKTSVPHTLMSGETVNNIVGFTQNPKNRFLSCGGSSGGEGALIGIRGSPIGFGTDIGGSIRIPAAFNGLFGIRPSGGRLPYEGMANSMDGQNSILSVVGPLATTPQSLTMMVSAILSKEPWLHDPLVLDLPWRDAAYGLVKRNTAQLTFAVLRDDGVVTPNPPVARAVSVVVDALKAAGHKVIDWTPPPHKDVNDIAGQSWLFDGGKDVHTAFALSGEPPVPQVEWVYGKEPSTEQPASVIAAVNVAKRKMQKTYMEYWNSTAELTGTGKPVDAVLAPLAPFPAARKETYKYVGYSMWVNMLDYTSVVVPVTNVDKSVDQAYKDFTPKDETDKFTNDACKCQSL